MTNPLDGYESILTYADRLEAAAKCLREAAGKLNGDSGPPWKIVADVRSNDTVTANLTNTAATAIERLPKVKVGAKRVRLTKLQRRQICQKAKHGGKRRALAEHFGCSLATIGNVLRAGKTS